MASVSSERPAAIRIEGAQATIHRRGLAARMGWAALLLYAAAFAIKASLWFLMSRAWSDPPPMVEALFVGARWMFTTALPLALAALAVRLFRVRRRSVVAIEGDRLILERGRLRWSIALARLVDGRLRPLDREVALQASNGDVVRVRFPRVEDAQRLLEAARLDASRRTTRMLLGETTFLDLLAAVACLPLLASWSVVYQTVPFFKSFLHGPLPLNVVTFIAGFFALRRGLRELFGPAQLVLGADGMLVQQRFRVRFVPHERVASIDAAADHIDVHLVGGEVVRVRARHLSAAQQAELFARMDDAVRAYRSATADGAALAQLDRGARSPAAWGEALRTLLSMPDSYRAQPVSKDDLVRVVASPAAPAPRRIGAAFALASTNDPASRAQIRVAAGACADKRVRIALERAAAGELDEAALAEAEADEVSRQRS